MDFQSAFQQAWNMVLGQKKKNQTNNTFTQQVKFPYGTPTYDDMGRIVGFTGAPQLHEPIDRSEQSVANAAAVYGIYPAPFDVSPFSQPKDQPYVELPQDERIKQDFLVNLFMQQIRRRYGI